MTRTKVAYIHTLYADRDDRACRSRYITVVLHPDVEHLRRAASRRAPGQAWVGVDGCFQPCPFRQRYDRRAHQWIDTTPAHAGVMRLHPGRLDAEIISHEATHAALHIWRLHQWGQDSDSYRADLGDDCGPDEEAFAYLLGGLVANLSTLIPAMIGDDQ